MESIKKPIIPILFCCFVCFFLIEINGQNVKLKPNINPKPIPFQETKFNFSINKFQIKKGNFQYYMAFIDQELNKMQIEEYHYTLPHNFKSLIKNLEYYYENEKSIPKNKIARSTKTPFYRVLNKTIYQLNKPITFFHKSQLTDVQYINKTMPNYKVSKTNDTYHIDTGFLSVNFDFKIFYYKNPTTIDSLNYLVKIIKQNTPKLDITPKIMVIQYNFNYGDILFQKTSNMSMSIQTYYEMEKDKTLIVNFTINQIYNFPPKIFGGEKAILSAILKNIQSLLQHSNAIKNE